MPPNLYEYVEGAYPLLIGVLGPDWFKNFLADARGLLEQFPSDTLEGPLGERLEQQPSANKTLRDMLVDMYCFRHRPDAFIGPAGWVLPFLEESLARLSAKISRPDILRSSYRSDLRDGPNFLGAFHEIVYCARLSMIGASVDLHVPNGTKNFDVRVNQPGKSFNVDVKFRQPNFPSIYHEPGEIGDAPFESRATVHPAFRGESHGHIPKGATHPESDQIRKVLRSAVQQLPDEGVNLVVLCASGTSREMHTVDAMFGDSYLLVGDTQERAARHPNGLIHEPSFEKISGVLRATISSGEMSAKLYRNPKAKHPIAAALKESIEGACLVSPERS